MPPNAPPTPAASDTEDAPSTFAVAWRLGRRALMAAAAVLLLVSAGLAVGLAVPRWLTPSDTSADAGFARDMQTHHAQAVEMSMLANRFTTDPDIATMAYDIALTQQAQIATMASWLEQWRLSPTGSRPPMAWMGAMADGQLMPTPGNGGDGIMPGMASVAEMNQLRAARGHDFDVLYCQLMIRHHLGGIAMVDAALQHATRPEVRALARSMKTSQQNEIVAFTAILSRLGAKP